MSNSVERDEVVVRKPAPVSLVASEQLPHQPHQSVTRSWLANLTSKPLGECCGSVDRQQRGRWDEAKQFRPPGGRTPNQTQRQFP